jgi:hypothetical protein
LKLPKVLIVNAYPSGVRLLASSVPIGSSSGSLRGLTIAICALDHLRMMKRAAGRPRDLVDLEASMPLSQTGIEPGGTDTG